jgi:hypothetical protein
MVSFVPIIEEGQEPFPMFRDLWSKYRDWVFEPIYYRSVNRLVEVLDDEIMPAQSRFVDLLARKAAQMKGRHI